MSGHEATASKKKTGDELQLAPVTTGNPLKGTVMLNPTVEETNTAARVAPASAFDRITKAVATADRVFDDVVQELAWMDIPVLVLPRWYVNVYPETASMRHAGALMHVIHTWDTHANRWGDDHQLRAIAADTSTYTHGKVVKRNGSRLELIGEFRILGVRGDDAYLAPVSPDTDTDKAAWVQAQIEAQDAAEVNA